MQDGAHCRWHATDAEALFGDGAEIVERIGRNAVCLWIGDFPRLRFFDFFCKLMLTLTYNFRKLGPLANLTLRDAAHGAFSARRQSVWTGLNLAPP